MTAQSNQTHTFTNPDVVSHGNLVWGWSENNSVARRRAPQAGLAFLWSHPRRDLNQCPSVDWIIAQNQQWRSYRKRIGLILIKVESHTENLGRNKHKTVKVVPFCVRLQQLQSNFDIRRLVIIHSCRVCLSRSLLLVKTLVSFCLGDTTLAVCFPLNVRINPSKIAPSCNILRWTAMGNRGRTCAFVNGATMDSFVFSNVLDSWKRFRFVLQTKRSDDTNKSQ